MNDEPRSTAAREAAARYFRSQGYGREASIVASGQGDDFSEVRIALYLWDIMNVPPAPPTKRKGRRLAGEEC